MALEATHIRFAVDLMEYLPVKVTDERAYITGTVYPDSRYITGTPRELTHPESLTLEVAGKDSFKLGWYLHLLCDTIGQGLYAEWFSDSFSGTELNERGFPWVANTAIKVLQSKVDISAFPIKQYLPHLNLVKTPNNEDPTLVLHFNEIVQAMYGNGESLSLEHEYNFWRLLTIGDNRADKVKAMCEQFQKNEKVMAKIPKLYNEFIARARNALNN